MKKALAWLLVIAMTAALAVGGTLAYLTDTDEDVNVMTVGKVKIDQLEYEREDPETNGDDAVVQEFHNNKPLYPAVTEDGFDWDTTDGTVNWDQIGKDGYTSGIWNPDDINNEQDKMVFVKNKGDFDAYVRTVFAFEAGNYETLADYLADVHLNLNETDWSWEWSEPPVTIGGGKYFIATATYNKVLAPGALTEISLSQIALDPSVTNEDVAGFGDTFQVLVQSQAVQAAGFEDADAALTEAFGELIFDEAEDGQPPFEIDPDDVPFEDDNPVEGTDVRTAIHYLNGNSADEKITAKVSSVTFGLNKDYADIVDTYDGTLVDVEQDVPVYAYYVKNGANYDVYLLANDVIYSPKDSSSLYQGMTALSSVDTSNYDVSRVESMLKMFRECSKLTSLDTTGWDTSKVQDMGQIFYKCSALQTITGLGDWDTSANTSFRGTFRQCGIKGEVDLSGWDASKVTDMTQMFYSCANIKVLNMDGWNAANVTAAPYFASVCSSLEKVYATDLGMDSNADLSYMFFQCAKLTEIVGSGTWNLENVTNCYAMFEYDAALTGLDVTDWGLNKLENAAFMFDKCTAMKDLIGEENWRLDNLKALNQMFMNCNALTALDSDDWGMGKAENLYLAFGNCNNMEYINTGDWDTGNFNDLTGTFQHCYKLKTVDVADWDTSNVTSMWGTFNASINIEVLDVSNWDVSKVENFTMMFQGKGSNAMDMKIKELDLSKWQPSSAVKMGHMFYGCAQLTELDLSGWVMPNLYTTSHMFADCINLEVIDVSGWQTTSSWLSMDAMFNDCRKVKTLDVSSWTTSGVAEFSQTFESCWSLQQIIGLENWDTSNGQSFDETFYNASSLKELNLSSFDTRKARYGNKHLNGDISKGFSLTFSGCNSLQKLILGENFVFDGDGTASAVCKLPNPGKIDGQTTVWYNEANDTYYTADQIPEGAATYIAVVKPAENG